MTSPRLLQALRRHAHLAEHLAILSALVGREVEEAELGSPEAVPEQQEAIRDGGLPSSSLAFVYVQSGEVETLLQRLGRPRPARSWC